MDGARTAGEESPSITVVQMGKRNPKPGVQPYSSTSLNDCSGVLKVCVSTSLMANPYLRAIFVCENFLKIKVFYLGLH